MITSIDEITKHSIIFVLYRSGSSGEFFSHAITQSFESITPTKYFWKTQSRLVYVDCFRHSLSSGMPVVNLNRIIDSFNEFLEINRPTATTTHIALVHPKGNSLEIITKYFSHCPVIEIVTFKEVSKRFQILAANSKIPDKPLVTSVDDCSNYKCEKHLLVEWQDIIMDTKKVFDQLQEFLSVPGDYKKFSMTVDDYKQRNQQLLDQL